MLISDWSSDVCSSDLLPTITIMRSGCPKGQASASRSIARSWSDSRENRGRNGCGRRLGEREMMKGLYCGGALAALAAASAASAQTAPLAEPPANAGRPADVIADIIVKAGKREGHLKRKS